MSQVEHVMSQAYQVIGALADSGGFFFTPEVQKALDYFSAGKFDPEFLPWTAPEKGKE
jgi:hypothetical protein